MSFFLASDQNRPSDFGAELKNIEFKKELINFLTRHWATESAAEYLGDKEVYISFQRCTRYRLLHGKVECQILTEFQCEGHEEADTKMSFFLKNIPSDNEVVIECSDTDILVILLANMVNMMEGLKVWLRFGTGNKRRFVNINSMYASLGELFCSGLPAFHAFTGCDFNPSFYGFGKVKTYAIYSENTEMQRAFAALQDPTCDEYHPAFNKIEEFVCKLYTTKANGLSGISSVNEARLHLFTKNYSTIARTEEFNKKLLNFDACRLPPCKRELHQQILRASYIGHLWRNSFAPIPSTLDALQYGWKVEDGSYNFLWFEGNELPECVGDILINEGKHEFFISASVILYVKNFIQF